MASNMQQLSSAFSLIHNKKKKLTYTRTGCKVLLKLAAVTYVPVLTVYLINQIGGLMTS